MDGPRVGLDRNNEKDREREREEREGGGQKEEEYIQEYEILIVGEQTIGDEAIINPLPSPPPPKLTPRNEGHKDDSTGPDVCQGAIVFTCHDLKDGASADHRETMSNQWAASVRMGEAPLMLMMMMIN